MDLRFMRTRHNEMTPKAKWPHTDTCTRAPVLRLCPVHSRGWSSGISQELSVPQMQSLLPMQPGVQETLIKVIGRTEIFTTSHLPSGNQLLQPPSSVPKRQIPARSPRVTVPVDEPGQSPQPWRHRQAELLLLQTVHVWESAHLLSWNVNYFVSKSFYFK